MSTDPPGDRSEGSNGDTEAADIDDSEAVDVGTTGRADDTSTGAGTVDRTTPTDADATDDTGYVHDPEPSDAAPDSPENREFGWRGWVLVGLVVFSFLIAPALILWRPPGLPYWVALLALPMLPGILLGIGAVWATTR